MKRIGYRLVAVTSALLSLSLAAMGATSPRRGGTLRVEFRATGASLDPREWRAGSASFGADEKLAALVFNRLVEVDSYGRLQPELATEWAHDAGFKRWQFTLRTGVKFSDGSALGAPDVVTALQSLLPEGQQVSAAGNLVVIQSSMAIPDLLEELASGRNFIYRVQADGTLLGTGPFAATAPVANFREAGGAAATEPHASRMRFLANEECWAGRPFLDEVNVTFGIPVLRQLYDLQLGHADLVELSPELVRRASQGNLRVWTSAPLLLFALRFSEAQPAGNENLREALALTLDRGTMAGVLLQKQAEPASALLPQWLSGYAFLFGMETNLVRAKEIRVSLPGNVATGAEPLGLRVDAAGDLAKLLGERVAVNARQAQLSVQIVNRALNRSGAGAAVNSPEPEAGLHLLTWRYSSLSPRVELDSLVHSLLSTAARENALSADPEQIYAQENKLLEGRSLVPLLELPEFVGIAANVRNWMPARWGEWHLADVWLDTPEASSNPIQPASASNAQQQSITRGAKP